MAVYMPELVMDKILKHLPTKVAVQVSFPSRLHLPVVSSAPVLNFDEDDDLDRSRHNLISSASDDYLHQHNKFINFLQGYSKYRDNKQRIDKLRLHMRMFRGPEYDIIHRWIELATQGDVKELDISIVNSEQCKEQDRLWYCVPWEFLVNAKSLTSLHMEGVLLPTVPEVIERDLHQVLLRSLKTVSLTNVILYRSRYFPQIPLLQNSSSIEYLSLTNCSFEYSREPCCYVEGDSSLKCLEVKYCKGIQSLFVVKSLNLESLTFVSPKLKCRSVGVRESYKLKKIDICVDQLTKLFIRHCHPELKVTINTQDLEQFVFCSSLESQVSISARVYWESIISVVEFWDEEWFLSNSTNFSALMDFLKGFGSCNKVWLCTRDSKALIIPKHLRKTICTIPTPLYKSCFLNVAMPNPPKAGSRDYLDLKDSMNWIAHSSRIVEYNRQWLVDWMDIFKNPEIYY